VLILYSKLMKNLASLTASYDWMMILDSGLFEGHLVHLASYYDGHSSEHAAWIFMAALWWTLDLSGLLLPLLQLLLLLVVVVVCIYNVRTGLPRCMPCGRETGTERNTFCDILAIAWNVEDSDCEYNTTATYWQAEHRCTFSLQASRNRLRYCTLLLHKPDC